VIKTNPVYLTLDTAPPPKWWWGGVSEGPVVLGPGVHSNSYLDICYKNVRGHGLVQYLCQKYDVGRGVLYK